MPRVKKPLSKPSVLAILGTTSAGKTALAVSLARQYNGEIISADSRQVYRGLDVGTGKDLAEYQVGGKRVRHHLIDVADPKRQFNLARYQAAAVKAIKDVIKRGKLPIVVGGSGLYLQALVDNYSLVKARVDLKQRLIWSKLEATTLYQELSRLKPEFAARLNKSDAGNARRLRRYLEIAANGEDLGSKQESPFVWLILGLRVKEQELKKRIRERLLHRLQKEDLVAEVEGLHQAGLSWLRLDSFGLEYRFVSRYLQGQLSYPVMVERLDSALWRFAKRQLSWFRRWEKQGAKISWVKDLASAQKKIDHWQKKALK